VGEVSDYRRAQAWKAGSKAANEGRGREANNRQHGTIYYDDWCDGFNEAERALWLKESTHD